MFILLVIICFELIFYRHDLEVNGGKGLIVDPRTKYVYQRPWAFHPHI